MMLGENIWAGPGGLALALALFLFGMPNKSSGMILCNA
jgi:hypothetical protein